MSHRGLRIDFGGLSRAANRGLKPLALGLALAFCAGCPKRQGTMRPPPQLNPPPRVEASAEARASELEELSRHFEETAQRLPGRTPEEHRAIMQQVFAALARILPVLQGPNPDGAFRQQLRIVESARTQLASGPGGLSPEPTIDTALRAARDMLASLASRGYFDQAQLGKTIDRLDATIAGLDTTRGLAHQRVVADSVEAMSQAIHQMSGALSQRVTEATAPSTQPSND